MAFDRSAFGGKGLQAATQHSSATVNDAGGFHSYLKNCDRPHFRKIPVGVVVFDIIPFIPKNDFGQSVKAGSVQYMMDVWAHSNIGPTRDTVICPATTLGQPCPICEERQRLEAAGASDVEIKKLKPKRRVVYNVWFHDQSRVEENKGVQILEGAHFSFEKNIQAIARHPVTGEFIFFADPDQGMSIAFTRTGAGATDTRYDGFQFVQRRGPIPDAILQQAVPLESIIEVLSYDELANKLHAGGERLQQPEDIPTYGQAAPIYGQSAPAQAPAAPTYSQPAAPTYGQAAPVYGQNAPAQAPTYAQPQPAPAQTAPVQPAPVQQTAAQDTPPWTAPVAQPQPAPVQTAPSESPMCPMADLGGVFGETLDGLQQCSACDKWDNCALAYENNHKAQ